MNQFVREPLIQESTALERVDCQAESASDGQRLHDLHDSVVQSLYSLTLLAEGWRRMAEAGQTEQADHWLAEIGSISRQTLREMRLLGCLLDALSENE